ncbi:ABC transporter ATP-binding protein [Microbaculum marinum]|uniref:ABC transporter ATP-binding protein n=1 Tax=Microbaculum marinum TaxID=1764581 RepID=A0AAW9REG3_9HYPH
MTGETLLSLDRATKRFGGITALDGLSFNVTQGEIVGVIGPNGAGKTTLFNVITGAYTLTSGTISYRGQSIGGLRPHRIAGMGIARTFQNIRLFASMTVWEHLLVAQPRGNGWSHLLPAAMGDKAARRRAEEVLTFFGLEDLRNRDAATLPYGLQRRVEMARALTAGPRLLLLDEPVAGMNADEAEELKSLLVALRDQMGLTILLIEHDMSFVMTLCEYLFVLDFGSKIGEGTPTVVRRDPKVLSAYLGDDE